MNLQTENAELNQSRTALRRLKHYRESRDLTPAEAAMVAEFVDAVARLLDRVGRLTLEVRSLRTQLEKRGPADG